MPSPTGRRCPLLGLAAWVFLAASVADAASPDLPQLKARGSIRALVTAEEYPEWFALQDSHDPGFERELLQGFADLHRIKLEVVVLDNFDKLIPSLIAGRGDVVTGLNDTPARRERISFTSEVLPVRHVAVSRRPQDPPRSLDELKGRKVAVLAGTTWEEVARAHVPAGQVVSFEKTDHLMAALRSGSANATVMAVSEFIWQRKRDPDLSAGVFVGPRLSAAWGLRKEDQQLRAAIDEYLRLKRQSAAWSRIVVKYFGSDALALLDRAGQR